MSKIVKDYELIVKGRKILVIKGSDTTEARKNACEKFGIKDTDILAVYKKGL